MDDTAIIYQCWIREDNSEFRLMGEFLNPFKHSDYWHAKNVNPFTDLFQPLLF